MTNGNENVGLGSFSQIYGEFNTAIGAFSEVGEKVFNPITFEEDIFPQNKAIAIGYRAQALCSNCAVIGGTGENAVKVGIGTDNPQQKLHVNGQVRIGNVPDGTGDMLLIDTNGDLVKSSNTNLARNDIDKFEREIKQQQIVIKELQKKTTSQQDVIEGLKGEVTELKSLVEKLLEESQGKDTKGFNYVLPLENKAMLAQNRPNPFDQNTVIDYNIPAGYQDVKIKVTSADGKELGVVDILEVGSGQVTIRTKAYPAGTYYYSLVLDGQVLETKRMVLTR